jgi:hypothetical protein
MARVTWDDLVQQYRDQGYDVYDYRKMYSGRPASTWGDATIGVHDSANSLNAAPTNPALKGYHFVTGVYNDRPWVRFNYEPGQRGAGVYRMNPDAGPQIAYAGPVGSKPGERTQAALDGALNYLTERAPELKKVLGHGKLYANDPRYSKHGRQLNEGSWAEGWRTRVNPNRTITSAEAQYPAPPIQTLEFDPARDSGYVQRSLPTERLQTTEDLIKLLKDGALPPLPAQAPGEGTVLEDIVIGGDDTGDAYGDVLQEVKKTPRSPYAPTPDVSSAGDTAKAPLTTASTLPPGGYGEFMPQPRGGNANEDLSPPPVVDSSGAPPPLPTTPGATPPRLRPDQTSDWVQWQHGQMQGALNTGPTQYVPPTQPKPVSQYNMNLSNLLGGIFKW